MKTNIFPSSAVTKLLKPNSWPFIFFDNSFLYRHKISDDRRIDLNSCKKFIRFFKCIISNMILFLSGWVRMCTVACLFLSYQWLLVIQLGGSLLIDKHQNICQVYRTWGRERSGDALSALARILTQDSPWFESCLSILGEGLFAEQQSLDITEKVLPYIFAFLVKKSKTQKRL